MLEQGSTEINQDQPPQHAVVSSFFSSAKYDREVQKLLCFLEFPEEISETMQFSVAKAKFHFVFVKHGFQLFYIQSMPFHEVFKRWIVDSWKVDNPAIDGVQTTTSRQ